MIKILRGPAGAGKSRSLYRTVLNLSSKNKDRNHILCVPEQFTLSAMRLIMEMSENKGMLNIDVLSFNRLSYRIFSDTGSDRFRLLDDTAKNLIIRHIASEKRDELTVFGPNLRKQGYISCVKSALSELMQYGCSVSDVEDMIRAAEEKEPYLACKLRDTRIIYAEFLKRLGNEYATVEDLYNRAALKAPEAGFLRKAVICFDGFTGFTPVQYELIKSLYEISEDIYVTVTDDGSGNPLFSPGSGTIDKLAKLSGGDIRVIDVNDLNIMRHINDPVFTFLGENIFRRNKRSIRQEGRIRIVRAKNIREETKAVFTRIRELTANEGLRYSDIAIILGNMGEYTDILKKEAMRCNVPLYADEARGIEFDPFAQLIRDAIACVREDMTYGSVFNFLRTYLAGPDRQDIDLAENYIRAFNIRGMKKYSAPFKYSYKGIRAEEIEAAELVRKRVYDLLKPLYDIRNGATVREYTTALYELGIKLGIEEKTRELSYRSEEAGDSVRKMEFDQVYGLIMELYDSLVSLMGDERMDIEEYSGMIDAGLSEIRVGTLPPSNDCVMAGDLTRSRFNDIKVLFIMGLCEGNIPDQGSNGGIISDMDRQFLKKGDFELAPTAEEKTDTSKFYYYMNILKPVKELILSYPENGEDGTVKRPSFFLKETKKLFEDIKIEEGLNSQKIFDASDALISFCEKIGEEDEAYLLFRALGENRDTLNIIDSHFKTGTDVLSREAAKALYENKAGESATELEKYAACAYAHYLQYGLGLRERLDFEFEARDIGTFLHEVLKNYSLALKDNGLSFAGVDDALSDKYLSEALEASGNEKLLRLFESSGRNAYMKKRVTRIAKRTVDTLRFQIKEGAFKPAAFEKSFSTHGLKGFIDRVDKAEDGQEIYLDIIDYKSGNKSFDRDRIYYGLDLQLVIYMNAAMEAEIASDGMDKDKVHPAGFFYYHIDDPLVDSAKGADDDEILSKLHGELKLRGIVNSDRRVWKLFDRGIEERGRSAVIPLAVKKDGEPDAYSVTASEEELKEMMSHTMELADSFKEAIKAGDIRKEPYELDGKTACDLCGYVSICDMGKRRKLKKNR
ncbi:MAG: PD-(D/E)XK nuclease family protein [Lachnospiraceae bacterium]|nr:PD-(D/E)XK nuclease family protein [Lachnospiraceae bacterium]